MQSDYKTIIPLLIGAVIVTGMLAVSVFSIESEKTAATTESASVIQSFTLEPEALEAEAAIVYDPKTGAVIFSKNDELQYPLASLTKLMTADVALSKLSPTTTIIINSRALQAEGDSNLAPGQVWQLGELIKYGLLVSSNDAMTAVAEEIGDDTMLQEMNGQAKKLALAQSYFLDPTGLDLTTGMSGAYGSAHDVAVLTADFYKKYPSFFESTLRSGTSFGNSVNKVLGVATAAPILDIPGLVGAKTGYTDLAGGNLVAVFDIDIGYPLVAVVLHSTEEGRFQDIRTLINATRTAQN